MLKLLAALALQNGSKDRQLVIGPGGESSWFRPYLGNGQEVVEWPPLRCEMPALLQGNVSTAMSRVVKDAVRKLLRRGSRSAFSSSAIDLTGVLKRAGVEVVHFPYQRYFPTSLPFIFEPWDLQHIHLPELFSKNEIEFRNWLYRQACEEASLVVTATHWTKDDLVRCFDLPPSKIAVIPRGAEMSAIGFAPQAIEDTLNKLQLPQRFALYPAKTWAHKNHMRLFRALAHLRDKEKLVIPLVCTGKPIETSLESIQRELGTLALDEQVFFTGFLDEDSMRHLYTWAELMVFPSLFEGLGIPVLEAMASGTPVVCSRVACLPEVAGDAAVFFDPYSIEDMAEKTALVWSDSALRSDLKQRGYANVGAYNWAEAALSFRVAYKHVANRPLNVDEARRWATMLSTQQIRAVSAEQSKHHNKR
ncbi:glycosyltransferase family 1 protein [Methylocaldum sp.]|uniref:glycosyltransferase family 4 protein n=1 Tax=Methylocaldum sp. TaxID=1969727 RepID=UPI00321FC859